MYQVGGTEARCYKAREIKNHPSTATQWLTTRFDWEHMKTIDSWWPNFLLLYVLLYGPLTSVGPSAYHSEVKRPGCTAACPPRPSSNSNPRHSDRKSPLLNFQRSRRRNAERPSKQRRQKQKPNNKGVHRRRRGPMDLTIGNPNHPRRHHHHLPRRKSQPRTDALMHSTYGGVRRACMGRGAPSTESSELPSGGGGCIHLV